MQISKIPRTNTTAIFVNSVHIWQSFPCIIMKMHNHVTISDEISLIYTLLYTEVLKMYQKMYQY